MTDGLPKVRVERLSLFRVYEENDTGWDYVQVPDSAGKVPDLRDEFIDQSIFAYDGVGFGPVTKPPSLAPSQTPYRETSTPGDEIGFISIGQYVDLKLFGTTSPSVIEVTRLTDSAILLTGNPEDSAWIPIVSDSVGTVAKSGVELCKFPATLGGSRADNPYRDPSPTPSPVTLTSTPDVGGWVTYNQHSDFVELGSGLVDGMTLTTSAARQGMLYIGAYADKVLFLSPVVYAFTFRIRSSAGTVPVEAILGHSELVSMPSGNQYLDEREVLQFDATTTATVHTVYWSPRFDSTSVFAAIRATDASAHTFYVDQCSIQSVTGYTLPATTDFADVYLKLPPWFSAHTATAYKLKLISGTVRAMGINRDRAHVVDLVNDFSTILRSLGNMRNITEGELEFRKDQLPPKVYHYQKRGVDHTKIAGGLDLRRAKNILVSRKSSDPNQVVNRLVLLGYGDDRTQLVMEVRATNDRQGRTPADQYYRYDDLGRAPTDPSWDFRTGGTSEEIFGVRYGKYTDPNLTTSYQAQKIGTQVVEISAWPLETFTIETVDLGDQITPVGPGDTVRFYYMNKEYIRRIIEIQIPIDDPRHYVLTLGDDPVRPANLFEQLSKDVETVLANLNQATGAANG